MDEDRRNASVPGGTGRTDGRGGRPRSVWRGLGLAGLVAAGLVVGPTLPASAEGGYFGYPAGDAPPAVDIVQQFLALNSEAVVSRVTLLDGGQLRDVQVVVSLDTDGDGEPEFALVRGFDGDSPALLDYATEEAVPGCAAALAFDDGGRSVTLSTSSACIGSPASVRAQVDVSLDEDTFDEAPPQPLFTAAVLSDGAVYGAIRAKYDAKGGSGGFLGVPLTFESGTRGGGRYNVFQGGVVLWNPANPGEAFEVHGAIRGAYAGLGAEWSALGFPTSDELPTGGGYGAVNLFQAGSVYWSPGSGAHEVYGAISAAWGSQGYEGGRLGFPTTGEFDIPGGRRSEFQGGLIDYDGATGATTIIYR